MKSQISHFLLVNKMILQYALAPAVPNSILEDEDLPIFDNCRGSGLAFF